MRKTLLKALLITPLLSANAALAHWALVNEDSSLSFVTVKAEHVAEVHTFDVLSGELEDDGEVSISVELASVNTMIPIRNERMQAMLFETNLFPEASISAQVDLDALTSMPVGTSQTMELDFDLEIRDITSSYTALVKVSHMEDALVATTLKPVIVNAETHNLTSGVEALREVAGLPSISRAVPVSFTIAFSQSH